MWEIDRDYINDLESLNRKGTTGETYNAGHFLAPEIVDLPTTKDKTRFIMKDDDGEIYYGGWLHNDDEGLNQLEALRFGMRDAGCTTIEVKIDGKWVMEIG